MEQQQGATGTFWDHLEVLRGVLLRLFVAVVLLSVVAFFFREPLFEFILAPKKPHFITYRWLHAVSSYLGEEGAMTLPQSTLINTQLAQQFIIHMRMSLYAAFVLIFPYILFELFRFISPALYSSERKQAVRLVVSGYFMFMVGAALSYLLIFPLTYRFLATYQVSVDVINTIVLDSYIDTFITLHLMMGLLFEIPILALLLAKANLISAAFMRRYRRHAVVALLVIAAVITPTSDAMTLLLVSLPMYLLYEGSILLVSVAKKREENSE